MNISDNDPNIIPNLDKHIRNNVGSLEHVNAPMPLWARLPLPYCLSGNARQCREVQPRRQDGRADTSAAETNQRPDVVRVARHVLPEPVLVGRALVSHSVLRVVGGPPPLRRFRVALTSTASKKAATDQSTDLHISESANRQTGKRHLEYKKVYLSLLKK